ncbi:MAG: ABC transporter substrate binding protein [Pseudomonadota bacterium]
MALLLFVAMATKGAGASERIRPVAAILLSNSESAYKQGALSFTENSTFSAQLFNLQGDIEADPDLKGKLLACKPDIIFALGAKAAYVAKLWTRDRQDIPVIFAMVLNWQRYKLLDGAVNIAGIGAELAPGTQFVNMTMFSPKVRRIGVVSSPHSTQILEQAQKAAHLLGMELVVELIHRSNNFQHAFKKLAGQVDAFWILNDPMVYTLENIDWLEERCLKEKLLCVGQTQNIARMGVALSINPDINQIGAQAASMARNIIENDQNPKDIGVMDPLATQILFNVRTAERIGLEVTPQSLDIATTVIR